MSYLVKYSISGLNSMSGYFGYLLPNNKYIQQFARVQTLQLGTMVTVEINGGKSCGSIYSLIQFFIILMNKSLQIYFT